MTLRSTPELWLSTTLSWERRDKYVSDIWYLGSLCNWGSNSHSVFLHFQFGCEMFMKLHVVFRNMSAAKTLLLLLFHMHCYHVISLGMVIVESVGHKKHELKWQWMLNIRILCPTKATKQNDYEVLTNRAR